MLDCNAKRGRNTTMHVPKVHYNIEDVDPLELGAIEALLSFSNQIQWSMHIVKTKKIIGWTHDQNNNGAQMQDLQQVLCIGPCLWRSLDGSSNILNKYS